MLNFDDRFLTRNIWVLLVVLFLFVLTGLIWFVANREVYPAHEELNPEAFTTLLRLPPNERNGIQFSEEWLARFPYSRTAYEEYAAGLADDVPCARWENGGITWWDRRAVSWERAPEYLAAHPELAVGWDAIVHFPAFRFCGFPEPYPEKPLLATPAT